MKGDYAYKCECGKLSKIDDEYEDFFVGVGEGIKRVPPGSNVHRVQAQFVFLA